ncbi:4'-phosphopantetheinyl transferase family protein [Nakamurella sp.]|uniref:4'-phosphopantetheinyl transferase family protein n=1 Tax=Nakamurella sp. TaxID=1869182 RepID=UPI003B3A6B8F
MSALATLLPPAVAVAQCRGDEPPGGDVGLYPGEQAAVATAVPARRREFTVARACARQALRRLGAPAGAIPPGRAGEPLWPAGVVGSITHCPGFAAAAVAPRSQLRTLGIDAEPHEPLPDEVLALTASAAEIAHLDTLVAADRRVHWGRLLFCTKEALYKAWYPVQQQWLGFEDADVRLSPDGSFRVRLLLPPAATGPFARCDGRWALDGDLLIAAVSLPAAE